MGKNDSGVRWLYEELPDLTARGVLTADAAVALRAHYGAPAQRTGVSLLVAISAVLGALLIGSGVVLLLAANWDQFPRPLRTALAFLPLLASQALGAFVLLRKNESTGWREGVALLNSLAVAGSIALVAQIYHIPGGMGSFLLTWMALTLPAIYLLQSAAAALLYLALAMSWTLDATGQRWPSGWLLTGAVLPVLVPMFRRGGLRAWWLAMATMIVGGVLLGATASEAHLDDIWIPAFAGYLTLLYVAGVSLRPDELHPFRWVGFAAIGLLSLIFTYTWLWTVHSVEGGLLRAQVASAVCAVVFAAGAIAAVLGFLRRVPVNAAAAAFPFVALSGYALALSAESWMAALLFNLYVFALSVLALRSGLARGRFAETNAGMLLLTALIVMRFFDTDVGFLVRGLAFIAAGVGFLTVNAILLKRREEQ